MWMRRRIMLLVLHFLLQLVSIFAPGNSQRPFNNSISAVFIFGDSTVDPGNNNFIETLFKSNFPPYGIDFPHRIPTGRFTDGRLVTDFMASYLGVKEYVPPYLDPSLSLEDLMTGVSFASACSGFDPLTPKITCMLQMMGCVRILREGVISIKKQLENFREYKNRLEAAIGVERTKTLINNAAFIISAGTNDLILNYYGPPFRRITYDIPSYQNFLLQNVQEFIQGLQEEGPRLIAMVGLPPIGCLPIVITVSSGGNRSCIDSRSSVALGYNQKLQNLLQTIGNSSSILIYADIYKPLNDIIQNPSHYGFENVNGGCCGTGLVEVAFMCNRGSSQCVDPSKYVFFDSVHPSEATYNYLFQSIRPTIDRVLQNMSPPLIPSS